MRITTDSETDDNAPSNNAEMADYESQIKAGVVNPLPYDRLMVAYRKERDYANELRVIKRAISVFQNQLKSVQQNILKGHRKRSRILELSKTISRKTGLIDNKGNNQHIPEPIAKWMKRQDTVEKKMQAAAKKKKKK